MLIHSRVWIFAQDHKIGRNFIKTQDGYIIRKRFSGATTLQQNHEEILNNGLCHFFHSRTSLHLFSPPLSHLTKNGYIIGIPFLTSTRLSYKKYKDISFGRVTSPLSNMTGRFSDLSAIQNNIGMEHHWNPLSYIYTSKIIKKPKH